MKKIVLRTEKSGYGTEIMWDGGRQTVFNEVDYTFLTELIALAWSLLIHVFWDSFSFRWYSNT